MRYLNRVYTLLYCLIPVACAIALPVHAQSWDLGLGLASVHFFNPDKVGRAYSNKLDRDGVAVANPLVVLRANTLRPKDYIYAGSVFGLNSVGRPMGGLVLGAGVRGRGVRVGAAFGAYIQSNRRFRDRGILPYSVYERNGQGLVPITGMEIQVGDRGKYFTNVFLSPIVGNVAVGFRF